MCGHEKLGYFQEIIPTHNFEHFGRYIQLIGLIGFEENNFPPMEDSTKIYAAESFQMRGQGFTQILFAYFAYHEMFLKRSQQVFSLLSVDFK